jgi:cobalt/nickel transport system permease protein
VHIPDGFLSGAVNSAGMAVSIAVVSWAVAHARKTWGDREVPLLGVTAAFIFAAQMINFPIAAGTSGHFLGAALAAILLGPLNAVLVMAVVLTIQCVVFADGGLTALGVNILNMGIAGGGLCYGIFAGLVAVLPKERQFFLLAAGITAWSSVMLSAILCALELSLSGTVPWRAALPAMAGVHALIGLGEAVITTTLLSMVAAARPDLVRGMSGLLDPYPEGEGV